MSVKKILQKIFDEIKSVFLSGLFTILPIALTFAFFSFTVGLITTWLNPIYHIIPLCLKIIPYCEFILVILTILLVGAVLKFLLLQPLVDFFEQYFLKKLPFIRTVYFGIKQLVQAFSPQDTEHFQKVILIEFPRTGIYSLGFLTNEVPSEIAPCKRGEIDCPTYYSVFVPNTPNPTTGYYVIIDRKECIPTNITRQEAMTLIISGGIIKPERFSQHSNN